MGGYLAINSIIGKSNEETLACLNKYLHEEEGEELKLYNEMEYKPELFSIATEHNNTSIVFPSNFMDWEKTAKYFSIELNAPVFSLHIHDGDLWMMVLYHKGEKIARFNPTPEYWDDSIPQSEKDLWKGDADAVCKVIPGLKPEDIKNYFCHWGVEMGPSTEKAYPGDEYMIGDAWQLHDFMKKINCPYPLDKKKSIDKLYYSQIVHAPEKKWWKVW